MTVSRPLLLAGSSAERATRWIAAAGLSIVVIAACGPSPIETGPDAALLFLVPETRPAASMQALYQGRVHLDAAGCFRLSDEPGGHTVIWPFGHRLAGDPVSLVILDESGREVGRVGHLLRLSGGEIPEAGVRGLLSPALEASARTRCPGGFWVTGEVLPPAARP